MIPRTYRLDAGKQLRNPTTHTIPQFMLKYTPNGLSYSRIGFIISKKVSRKATIRNRAKRVFRSCLENKFKQIKSGYDILFILQGPVLQKDYHALCLLIEDVLVKQKLL